MSARFVDAWARARLTGLNGFQAVEIVKVGLEPMPELTEDLFSARALPGTMLASERFKQFVDINEITNVPLISAGDYRRPVEPYLHPDRDLEVPGD